MRRPFGKLMEMAAERLASGDTQVTLGQLATEWDEPVARIMDAIDALKVVTGEPSYLEIPR